MHFVDKINFRPVTFQGILLRDWVYATIAW